LLEPPSCDSDAEGGSEAEDSSSSDSDGSGDAEGSEAAAPQASAAASAAPASDGELPTGVPIGPTVPVDCVDEDRDYWRGFAQQRDYESSEAAAAQASAAASAAPATDGELPTGMPIGPTVPVECVDEDREYWRGFAQQRDYALQTFLTGRFWQNPDEPDPFAHLGPVETSTVNLNVADDDDVAVDADGEAGSLPQRGLSAAPAVETGSEHPPGASPLEVVEEAAGPEVESDHSPPPGSGHSPGDAAADGSTTDPSSYVECEDDANALLQSKVAVLAPMMADDICDEYGVFTSIQYSRGRGRTCSPRKGRVVHQGHDRGAVCPAPGGSRSLELCRGR